MADLTSLANVKDWLGITTSSSDATLTRLISAVSVSVVEWLNQGVLQASYTEMRDGHGGTSMVPGNMPLVSVQSITVDNNLVPANQYVVDDDVIVLTNGYFNRGRSNVVLQYTSGYATVPLDLEQAVIDTVSLRFRERERIGVTSKAMAGETTAYLVKDFSPSAISIMTNYKRVTPT